MSRVDDKDKVNRRGLLLGGVSALVLNTLLFRPAKPQLSTPYGTQNPQTGISANPQSGVSMGAGLPPAMVSNPPDIYVNMKTNQAVFRNSQVVPATQLVSVSRASPATQVNASGVWSTFLANQHAMTDLGHSIWEARTNSIRNNTMVGAVVMADGVELLTNGNFASSGTGWTIIGAGTVVFAAGSVTITGDGSTTNAGISQQITGLVVGKSYVLSLPIGQLGGFFFKVGTSAGDASILAAANVCPDGNNNALPSKTAFTATGTTAWISVTRTGGTPVQIYQISVQDGERCQDGSFTSSPLNAAQSTVQNGWQWNINAGAGTITYVGGNSVQIVGDTTHNSQFGTAAIPTVSGFTYTITADITGQSASVIASTAAMGGGSNLLSVASGTTTGQKFQFTATSTTTYLLFQKTANGTTTIANVSVQSAGALPTNWSFSSTAGPIMSVLSVGVQNGMNVLTLRFAGTANGTGNIRVISDTSAAATSTYGQTWTSTIFLSQAVGAVNATGIGLFTDANNAGGGYVTTYILSPLSVTSSLARIGGSFTVVDATVASLSGQMIQWAPVVGAVDTTLTFGWPQLENNSLINSTVASAVKAADGAGGVNGSAVYSVGGGSGSTTATLNVTWTAGVMAVNSVANAGSYTTFPPSPSTLTYVSGTATGWTGATVTLTPTDLHTQAAASNPILTTSAAVTRNAEADTLVLTGLGLVASPGGATLWVRATPATPTSYPVTQLGISLNDGTVNNRAYAQRVSVSGAANTSMIAGAVQQNNSTAATWSQSTSGKLAFAVAASDQSTVFNGGAPVTGSGAAMVTGLTTVYLGGRSDIITQQLNGNLEEFAIWFNQRLPNATLQAITA